MRILTFRYSNSPVEWNKTILKAVEDGITHVMLSGSSEISPKILEMFPDSIHLVDCFSDKLSIHNSAGLVIPIDLMIKYRLHLIESIPESNAKELLMLKLMLVHDEPIIVSRGFVHDSKLTLYNPESEATRLLTESFKFYENKFKKRFVVDILNDVFELTEPEFLSWSRILGTPLPSDFDIINLNGMYVSSKGKNYYNGSGTLIIAGRVYPVVHITTVGDSVKSMSPYVVYRMISSEDPKLKDVRDAIKDRYFNNTPIPEEIKSKTIVILGSWKRLSE